MPSSSRLLALPAAALTAVVCLAASAPAQATWGPSGECRLENEHHCYAVTEDNQQAYAAIGDQYAETIEVFGCTEGFVDQEEWIFPESTIHDKAWIEAGQIIGRGYCDQKPHVFFAYLSPTEKNVFHFEESTLGTYAAQYNDYAMSDLPEKNGHWHLYWRIPEESSTWTAGPVWAQGWSAKSNLMEAGMEIATEEKPIYAGKTQTAWTNTTITPPPNWNNWTAATYTSQSGATCLSVQGLPGNINTGSC